MADENWQQIRKIFDQALLQKRDERRKFVRRACAGDEVLLAEVESLLSSLDSAENFMETPAVANVADVIEAETKKLGPGKCFGHYEIIDQIGVGGMGEVYLAKDKKLDRKVAVKTLNEKFSREESNLNRFIQEAKAASALNHPNILVIHEIGSSDDAHYIISEFIKGKTLREVLKQSSLKLSEILDISIQIASALAVAHEANLVHRDIKPENIMIRPDGFVKVLDFGLAKLVERKNKSILGLEEPTLKQNETGKGIILGTINYMSPEQARAKDIDERTDIWSVGVCLYEMLTGRSPFAEETTSDTISAILTKTPAPLPNYVPDIPKELERIVNKALRKNREERYQNIKDLLIDLQDFKQESEFESKLGTSETPLKAEKTMATQLPAVTDAGKMQPTLSAEYITTQIKSHRVGFGLAFIVLLIAAASIGYYFLNPSQTAFNFQAGQTTRLTSNGKTTLAAVSPDGKFIAYVIDNEGEQSLWLKNIATGSDVQIQPPVEKATIYSVIFSPDGNYIFFGSKGTLSQIPVLGGTPKKILSKFGGSISFSPDGKQFAFLRYSSDGEEKAAIVIVKSDGSEEQILASSKRPNIFLRSPVWSPDGKVIACVALTADGTQEVVTVRVTDGVVLSVPSSQWITLLQVAWQPDGNSLLVLGEEKKNILTQIWSLSYPSGERRKITADSHNYESISLSADGSSLAVVRAEQEAHLWVMPAEDASRARQITSGAGKYDGTGGINWTADGKIIYENAPDGRPAVWRIDSDGRNSKELFSEGGTTAASPDGNFLVYQTEDAEGIGLFRLNVQDGEKKRLTTGADLYPVISPDGKWIVFTRYADDVALWKVPLEGGKAVKLTDVPGYPMSPAISPDGKLIAFFRGVSGKMSFPPLSVVPIDGGKIVKEFDARIEFPQGRGKIAVQWTRNGQAIDYVSLRDNVSNIWRQPIDGSPPFQVTNFTDRRIFNFAYSHDGKQFALSCGTFNRDVILINNFVKNK